jgi:hypothetical protein
MKHTTFTIALVAMLFSCSKSNPDDPAREQALTTGSWKLTAYATDNDKDGTYEENTFAMIADCQKDNLFTFQSGGVLVQDEGPTKCGTNYPQSVNSTWSFLDNRSKLKWGTTTYQIEELTQSSLILKTSVPYNVIFTVNIRAVYTKQ